MFSKTTALFNLILIPLTTNKQNSADRAQGLRYFAYFRPLGNIQKASRTNSTFGFCRHKSQR